MNGFMSYADFFAAYLDAYNARFPLHRTGAKPLHKNWMKIGKPDYPPGAGYHLSFTNDGRFRIEITFQSDSRDLNKFVFGQLVRHREGVETEIGSGLEWERKDDLKRAQISFYFPGESNEFALSQSAAYLEWAVPASKHFQDVINRYLSSYGQMCPPS